MAAVVIVAFIEVNVGVGVVVGGVVVVVEHGAGVVGFLTMSIGGTAYLGGGEAVGGGVGVGCCCVEGLLKRDRTRDGFRVYGVLGGDGAAEGLLTGDE